MRYDISSLSCVPDTSGRDSTSSASPGQGSCDGHGCPSARVRLVHSSGCSLSLPPPRGAGPARRTAVVRRTAALPARRVVQVWSPVHPPAARIAVSGQSHPSVRLATLTLSAPPTSARRPCPRATSPPRPRSSPSTTLTRPKFSTCWTARPSQAKLLRRSVLPPVRGQDAVHDLHQAFPAHARVFRDGLPPARRARHLPRSERHRPRRPRGDAGHRARAVSVQRHRDGAHVCAPGRAGPRVVRVGAGGERAH